MHIFFSHPTFTFKTTTERKCIGIIKEYLEPDEITNPADFGIKHDVISELKEADAVVAMAVSGCFTYLVWKEMELRKKEDNEVKIYTFMVQNKEDIGPLVKGIPEGIKKLSKEESKRVAYKINKKDYQDGFISSLFGSHRSRF